MAVDTYPCTQLADVTTKFLWIMAPPQRRAFLDSKMTIATHVNSPNPVPNGARPLGCVPFEIQLKYYVREP